MTVLQLGGTVWVMQRFDTEAALLLIEAELPRHPTGKLYKQLLRDRYWTTE